MQSDDPDAILMQAIAAARSTRSARERWLRTARKEQLTPAGDWWVWLIMAGRGFGKTRTGAEDLAWYGQENADTRLAVVAPTYSDARDICIEGESGLLNVVPGSLIQTWNRSLGELVLTNKTRIKLFSAEEPERLRGPQHHRVWCDELAAWQNQMATWDQIQFGLRLGQDPRCVVTTTPKPTPLIRQLVAAPTTYITRGSTFDNAANLAPSALAKFRAKYEGTRLGRQELDAELLEDVQGALWTRAMVEDARLSGALPAMRRIVVAVDPSGSDGTSGDMQGIVVAGEGVDGRGYVVEDASMRGSPDEWCKRVAFLFHKHQADRVVAEKNYGGAMVEAVLRAAAPNLPVVLVTASRGKHVRAEPIAALYEQKRITHAEPYPELEDELVLMTGAGYAGTGSPNRLDAMVWGFTELMLADNAQGWVDYYAEMAARVAAGLPPEPEVAGATPHRHGEAGVPNAVPALKAPDAPKVRMIAPANVSGFDLMPEAIRYVVGRDRAVEVHPEMVERMKAQGCRLEAAP